MVDARSPLARLCQRLLLVVVVSLSCVDASAAFAQVGPEKPRAYHAPAGPRLLRGGQSAQAAPATPFSQCPSIGSDPSCGTLLVVNPDRTVSVYSDQSVGPYDASEDTLVGVENDSALPVTAIVVSGPSGLFAFDGDGLCTQSGAPAGCPFGTTGYEGPSTSFTTDPSDDAHGEVDFSGTGLLPHDHTYFSLETAATAATLNVRLGTLTGQAGQTCVGRSAPGAGQTAPDPGGGIRFSDSFAYDRWQGHFAVSACEGLVIDGLSLGRRTLAERLSVPYLDLQMCTPGASGTVASCSERSLRHITLQPAADETAGSAHESGGNVTSGTDYTEVQLLGPPKVQEEKPTGGLCTGGAAFACAHESISATYRVFLSSAGSAGDYLDVTQKYEFYREFNEDDHHEIACEPAHQAPGVGAVLHALDCARWKPLVTYQYHPASPASPLLEKLTAAARLHFTPENWALRASTLARDCDSSAPRTRCFGPFGNSCFSAAPPVFCFFAPEVGAFVTSPLNPQVLELYPPSARQGENPIRHATVIRGLYATGSGALPGRYDNVHMTAGNEVGLPLPIPPGCGDCVHMHWRWGADILGGLDVGPGGRPEIFGDGSPLVRDAEPAAQPGPSNQTLDVGIVPYHSEDLTPYNFMNLFPGASPESLDMRGSNNKSFTGGIATGSETLDYPSGSCYDAAHPVSWGQCGQVLWLSATTSTFQTHDEDADTFFAFGGFFCSTCAAPRATSAADAWSPRIYHSNGSGFSIDIGTYTPSADVDVFVVLPPTISSVSTKVAHIASQQVGCTVTTGSSGEHIVHCKWRSWANHMPCVGPVPGPNPDPRQPSPPTSAPCITIQGQAPPGRYQDVVHVAWGDTADDTRRNDAGNYRTTDAFTVGTPKRTRP